MLTTSFVPHAPALGPSEEEEVIVPSGLPEPLAKDYRNLSKSQRDLVVALLSSQGDRINHLFETWTSAENSDTAPAFKRRLITQLEVLDKSSASGGLVAYLNNARHLLEESGSKVDSLKGWKPTMPTGETFEVGSEDYKDVEKLGRRELDAVGFVLAAGGAETKIGLPIDLATGTTYLQLYIKSILAIEGKCGHGCQLPLCIMTSDKTNEGIAKLLEGNDYFGMVKDQITILQEGLVPTVEQKNAKLILNPGDDFKILTESHGNGDIHALLHKHDVTKKWKEHGTEWIVFLPDANGLAFHNLALLLGMSVKHSLAMNMLSYPRKAKEAVESIVKLVNEETNETRTISLDYDQLDPLLRSSGYIYGDQKDGTTGLSYFPGSTNQFVFNLERYVANLDRTTGIMPEFVVKHEYNPKQAHLECRMQDISTILTGRDALKVGYTCVPSDYCFSPVDTTAKDGSTLQRKGMMPRCIASGEADQYAAHCKMMRAIGCEVDDARPQTFHGVTVSLGPQIIIKPDAACLPGDYSSIFPNPEKIVISDRSSLVISGPGVVIESLDLDGALVVQGKEGVEEQVVKNRVIKNLGWVVVEEEDSVVENVAMRGYRLEKKDTETVVFSETLMDVVAKRFTCV